MKNMSKIEGLFLIFIVGVMGGSISVNPKSESENSIYSNEFLSQNPKKEGNIYLTDSYTFDDLSNYSLWVRFLEISSQVEGILEVDYFNEDPIDIEELPFHLFPYGMEYEYRPGDISILGISSPLDGGITLNYTVEMEYHLLWVELPALLSTNERVQFKIHFITTLPDGGIDRASDSGSDNDETRIIKFAAAYPMPCVWDEFDGWNTDPYLDIGDPFYSDMAYYTFAVQVPTGHVVAATGGQTGTEINGSDTIFYFDPGLPVRELTFSSSRYFVQESELVLGINVSTFYLLRDLEFWSGRALNTAVHAISFYSENIGPYPYPTFNVVEEFTQYGGMEHACQVYIAENYREYLEITDLIIAHETAHQWFYHLVGNDQVDAGFLDEGLVCWLEDYCMDELYPYNNYLSFSTEISSVRSYNQEGEISGRINQSIYECIDTGADYWNLAYRKAPVVIEKLRQYIGDDDFIAGLQYYFQENIFQFAWLSDFQAAFEHVTGTDLDWFFNMWYNNPYLPDYYLENVVFNSSQNLLEFTVVDLNEDRNLQPYFQNIYLGAFSSTGLLSSSYPIVVNGTSNFSISLYSSFNSLGFDLGLFGLAESLDGNQYIIFDNLNIEYIVDDTNGDDTNGDDTNGDDTNGGFIGAFPWEYFGIASVIGLILLTKKIKPRHR
ncbi:MAG: M1 family metallopeptidase [Promethearchaeota archaeon]